MATSVLVSAEVNVLPADSFAEDSGPRAPVDKSTPATLKKLPPKLPRPRELPELPPNPPPLPKLPMVSEILLSFSVSAPVAAATFLSLLIDVTEAVPIGPYWALLNRFTLILVPDFGLAPVPPAPGKPNPVRPGVPEPKVGAWVTVMSVPTPYSECSTADCAFFAPADAAVTMITSPTPSARPSAIKMACLARRRNSRCK